MENIKPKFKVKKIYGKGRGLFASRNVKKGEKILTFRFIRKAIKNDHHTLQIDYDKHIVVGRPESYINHSCDPNCGVKGLITLIAMRPIKKTRKLHLITQ